MAETSPGRPARPERRGREPHGWRDVVVRVRDEARRDNLTLVSAGVAFYGLLALAPGLAAVVALYGLVSTPEDVRRQVNSLSAAVPAEVRQLLDDQLTQIVSSTGSTKGIGLVFGVALALWSSSAAMKHLMAALSSMYDEDESRGFVKLRVRALLLTVAVITFLLVMLVLLAVVPAVVDRVGAPGTILTLARWPIMAMLMMTGLSVLYRLGPDRDQPRWRWVSWGSVIATLVWLVGSLGFSLYASSFANYTKTYGSMAAVVVTMVWLWITALCVLLGAEINAELEHRAHPGG